MLVPFFFSFIPNPYAPSPFFLTQNVQACTCCDDTHLVNANLKMNANSPFDGENNWACREK